MTKTEVIAWVLANSVFVVDSGGRLWRQKESRRRRDGQRLIFVQPKRADERTTSNGYRRTFIAHKGARFEVVSHRLVIAIATGSPVPEDMVVHHWNSKRQDNRPKNLEVTTHEQNQAYINWTRILGSVSAEEAKERAWWINVSLEMRTTQQVAQSFDVGVEVVQAINRCELFGQTPEIGVY